MQEDWCMFQCMYLEPLTNKEVIPAFIADTNIPCEIEVKLLGITIVEKVKLNKR